MPETQTVAAQAPLKLFQLNIWVGRNGKVVSQVKQGIEARLREKEIPFHWSQNGDREVGQYVVSHIHAPGTEAVRLTLLADSFVRTATLAS